MDGDGSIAIAKASRSHRPNPVYAVNISLINRNLSSLQFVQSAFGGRINTHKAGIDKQSKSWRSVYVWHCSMERAKEFLLAIYPYLRIKKRNGEIALEFIEHTSNITRRRGSTTGKIGGSEPLNSEEINYREMMRNQMKKLNTRGIPPKIPSGKNLKDLTIV